MATLSSQTARIRRISLDEGNPANYTLASTTFYDNGDPTDSTGPWGTGDADVAAMDQALSLPSPPALEVEHPGALIEFVRQPFRFVGITVKVRPEYDTLAGEDPSLELWTQQQGSNVWTLRRRIQFASLVGAPTGRIKYFDLSLSTLLSGVVRVWVVMNPGATGNPTMKFSAIHVFGKCRLRTQGSGCYDDPTTDCMGEGECEDPTKDECLIDPLDCEDFAPEVCDLPPFAWPKAHPTVSGIPTQSSPPSFPTIDLCDADALEAYKAELTPDQLAFFEELLDQAQLPCLGDDRSPDPVAPINADPDLNPILPRQPVEVYVDPTTGEPAQDPRNGAGSIPSNGQFVTSNHHFFFFATQAMLDDFLAGLVANEGADIQAVVNRTNNEPVTYVIFGENIALDRVFFNVNGGTIGDRISILAKSRGGSPAKFDFWPDNLGASITTDDKVFWLLDHNSRTTGFGATVENSPMLANEVAVGSGSSSSPQIIAVAAGNTQGLNEFTIPIHSEPTEELFTIDGGDSVCSQVVVKKHLSAHVPFLPFGLGLECACDIPDADTTPVQGTGHTQHYFRITVKKHVASFAPSRTTPAVFVTQAHTLDSSDIRGACPTCP